MAGYVKLNRDLLDDPIFQNSDLLKVYLWCLLKAQFKDGTWDCKQTGRGSTIVKIGKGQFVFGRKQAALELKMKETSVNNRMLRLEKYEKLDRQVDSHYTIITVRELAGYDGVEDETEQATGQASDRQVTGKCQASDRQVTHKKKVKKEKNVKNVNNVKKTTTKEEVEFPDWLNVPLFEEYLAERKALKIKTTTRGKKLLFTELKKLIDEGYDQAEVIQKATVSGWKSFYPTGNKANKKRKEDDGEDFLTMCDKHIEAEKKRNVTIINPFPKEIHGNVFVQADQQAENSLPF